MWRELTSDNKWAEEKGHKKTQMGMGNPDNGKDRISKDGGKTAYSKNQYWDNIDNNLEMNSQHVKDVDIF